MPPRPIDCTSALRDAAAGRARARRRRRSPWWPRGRRRGRRRAPRRRTPPPCPPSTPPAAARAAGASPRGACAASSGTPTPAAVCTGSTSPPVANGTLTPLGRPLQLLDLAQPAPDRDALGRPFIPPRRLELSMCAPAASPRRFTEPDLGVRAAGVEPRLAHARHLRRQPRHPATCSRSISPTGASRRGARTRASRPTSATGLPTATSTGSPTSATALSPTPARSPGSCASGVDQNPGPAAAGRVLAVPATTVTHRRGAGADHDRRALRPRRGGRSASGTPARSPTPSPLLGDGRVIAASRRAGLVVDDRAPARSHERRQAADRRRRGLARRPDARALERAPRSCSRTWPAGRAGRCRPHALAAVDAAEATTRR